MHFDHETERDVPMPWCEGCQCWHASTAECISDVRRRMAEHSAPPIAGAADTERESRLDAERVTLEFRARSTRRLDAGRAPITDSPLFGGPSQQELF